MVPRVTFLPFSTVSSVVVSYSVENIVEADGTSGKLGLPSRLITSSLVVIPF